MRTAPFRPQGNDPKPTSLENVPRAHRRGAHANLSQPRSRAGPSQFSEPLVAELMARLADWMHALRALASDREFRIVVLFSLLGLALSCAIIPHSASAGAWTYFVQ